MKQSQVIAAAVFAVATLAGSAQAALVSGFDATYVANGSWFLTDTRPGGTATIETLSGGAAVGAPLPTGAAKLTTTTGASKAEVGVRDNYGMVRDILSTLDLHFAYYKEAVGDAAPAPSLKLSFLNPNVVGTGANRGFITLIWEAYVQPFPAFVNPTPGVWTNVDIDHDTGRFWGTNGFGHSNSAGGAPYRTLDEWVTALSPDFLGATLVDVMIGVGTNNVNQVGYFDDVRIQHDFGTGYNATYDFEAASEASTPGSLHLAALAVVGLLGMSRRKRA